MNHVQTIRSQDDLPPEIGAAIFELTQTVWPPEGGKAAPDINETLASWKAESSTHFIVCEKASQQVLAHARIFRREIRTEAGPLAVGALAAVCVHPASRGKGFGADVVRAAFNYLPQLGVGVSLFQTGVPHFHEKLGSRVVTNRFFNGDNPNNPFWDMCEMIYPAQFAWPDGAIDLNGEGY